MVSYIIKISSYRRIFMKFCWSTLNVKNMEESLKFYEEVVGLTVDKRFQAGPGMEIAFLGDGETKVELIYNENSTDINVGKDISWGFEVKSVDEMMNFVKEKGIAIEGGPFQPNPHVKFFYVKDPNGLKIQFVENM
jgi:lactoylglutathione lyase